MSEHPLSHSARHGIPSCGIRGAASCEAYPPELALLIASRIAHPNERESFLGDLQERFSRDANRFGTRHARSQYWRDLNTCFTHQLCRHVSLVGKTTTSKLRRSPVLSWMARMSLGMSRSQMTNGVAALILIFAFWNISTPQRFGLNQLTGTELAHISGNDLGSADTYGPGYASFHSTPASGTQRGFSGSVYTVTGFSGATVTVDSSGSWLLYNGSWIPVLPISVVHADSG